MKNIQWKSAFLVLGFCALGAVVQAQTATPSGKAKLKIASKGAADVSPEKSSVTTVPVQVISTPKREAVMTPKPMKASEAVLRLRQD